MAYTTMKTREDFIARVGRVPADSELLLMSCISEGCPHTYCGWCVVHDFPFRLCDCKKDTNVSGLSIALGGLSRAHELFYKEENERMIEELEKKKIEALNASLKRQ